VTEAAPTGPFGGHATLADGLVSYWPLSEESGTRAALVGTNDLTDNNTVGFASVTPPPNFPAGKAASFVAANAEFLSSATESNVGVGDFTISAWVYSTGLAGAAAVEGRGIASYHSNGTAGDWYLSFGSTGRVMGATWEGGATGPRNITDDTFAENQWHHVVYRRSSGTYTIWVNGVSRTFAVGSSGSGFGNNKFRVGESYPDAGSRWNGHVAHVARWTEAKTDGEIVALYAAGAGLFYED